jgi:hypothetical protein
VRVLVELDGVERKVLAERVLALALFVRLGGEELVAVHADVQTAHERLGVLLG